MVRAILQVLLGKKRLNESMAKTKYNPPFRKKKKKKKKVGNRE